MRQVPLLHASQYMRLARDINRQTGYAVKYMRILRQYDNRPNTVAFIRFYADAAHQVCIDKCAGVIYDVPESNIEVCMQFKTNWQYEDRVVDRYPEMLVYEVDVRSHNIVWHETQVNPVYHQLLDVPRPPTEPCAEQLVPERHGIFIEMLDSLRLPPGMRRWFTPDVLDRPCVRPWDRLRGQTRRGVGYSFRTAQNQPEPPEPPITINNLQFTTFRTSNSERYEIPDRIRQLGQNDPEDPAI